MTNARPGAGLAWLRDHFGDPHGEDDPCARWPYGHFADGYGCVYYEGRSSLAHVVALTLRDGPAPRDHEACHTCRQKDCVIHVRWGTCLQNKADMLRDGTRAFGERCGSAKLTADKVRHLRELLAEGHTRAAVAREIGCDWCTVDDIRRGRTWSWLT